MKKLFLSLAFVSATIFGTVDANATAAESYSVTSNYETTVTATARTTHARIQRRVTVVCNDNGTPQYVMDQGNRRNVRFNGTDWEFTDGNLVFHFTV